MDTTSFFEQFRIPLARLKGAPWLAPVINGAALLLFVASAAHWTWQLFEPMVPRGLRGVPISAPMPAVRFSVPDIQSADLFGAPPLTADNLNAIPVSSLNLVLTGVVEAGARSFALIKAGGHHQAPFVIGQSVVPGAALVAVYADRALIRYHGQVESLLLKQPVSATVDGVAAETQPVIPLPVHKVAVGHYLVPPALVKAEMANPQPLFDQAVMVPYQSGGFLIRSIKPGSLYQKLGLRPGDVIRSVNGQPIDSLEQAMQVYKHLPAVSEIDLQILRNGQPKEFYYHIQ
ncbi:MAG: type II secretion system protein N [Acidiferrobacteraceae bacterium]